MTKTRFRSPLAAIPALALACALAACSTTTPPKTDASHRGPATRLQDVMRGFDEAVRKNVPGETDVHDRWSGVFASIADAAAGLKEAARDLSGHPPDGLELPARGRFQVLAHSLGDAAGRLEEAAARNDADAVSIARTEVAAACRDCHSRYRKDAPGVPDAFR